MTRLEQLVHASERLGPRTKKLYAAGVQAFVRFAGSNPVLWSPQGVQRWFDSLRELTPQTANVHLKGVRFAFRRYARMGYGPDAASPVEYRKPGPATRTPQALTAPQAVRLLASVEDRHSLSALRDRVILLLGLVEGLRCEEMAGLLWRNVADDRLVQFRRKGGKLADHTLDDRTLRAIDALLSALPAEMKRTHLPMLTRRFRALDGKVAPLSKSGIYGIVQARARQAGFRVGPHELRHTCGSLALQAGVPPWRVAQHLGQTSETTLMRHYAHDLRAAEGDPVGASVGRMLEDDDG